MSAPWPGGGGSAELSRDLHALVEDLHRRSWALTRHRSGVGEPLSAEQVIAHSLAVLTLGATIAEIATSGRWVYVREALAAGAGVEPIATAMGLDPDELRLGVGRWADRQHRSGHLTDAEHAAVLALVTGGESS
ncbi:MAG: hypothetical protein M3Q39_08385 [Actinomycetota bacterium]|nr:hypothetical protein [Actinomycetota bacterium]